MRRDLMNRIRRLEELSQIDVNLVLTFADGKQAKMLGRASHFFRMLELLNDPDAFEATRSAAARKTAEGDLGALRRAIRIEGDSAQLFWLLKALAAGPVDVDPA